jgi:hypothetical protein
LCKPITQGYSLAAGPFTRDHLLPNGGYKQSEIGKDLGREVYLANR